MKETTMHCKIEQGSLLNGPVGFATKLLLVTTALMASDLSAQTSAIDGGAGQNQLVSTNTGTTEFNGASIAEIVGATEFYRNGYTGSRSVAAIVEGGHIWSGHETLDHTSGFFDARDTFLQNGLDSGQLGEFDRHATWTGHTLAGRGEFEYQRGIAFGADLWSGAIATQYNGEPFTGSWGWTRGYAFSDPYSKLALDGQNSRTADVINSSWGSASETNPETRGGNSIFTITYDAIAQASGAVFVASAGNNHDDNPALSIGRPANGYNGITVGALGDDLADSPYSEISNFSTRGAQDYNGPDGFVEGVRAVVDIVAPGSNLTLAFYGGTTGGNNGGTDSSNGATDFYSFNVAGTSFSSPIVAGGASLLVDVARDRFSSNIEQAKNGQVIKAVLLNSADKPAGWDNGQSIVDGVVTTDQSLDYTYGAGRLDLESAYAQFTAGTTGEIENGGGEIQTTGWDFGSIEENEVVDYIFDTAFDSGSQFSATLNWFVGRTWEETLDSGSLQSTDDYFTDLSLELWTLGDSGLADSLVAISDAEFINTEHFSFQITETDNYLLRVRWDGERYDFVDNSSQTYGLAWHADLVAVPEPTTSIPLLACVLLLGRFRRKRC